MTSNFEMERVNSDNRVFSGMNLVAKEIEKIFLVVMDGGNHIYGFTNASIRTTLFPELAVDDKKVRNKTTRIITKLRAHKLIVKIPHSFRYKMTPKGIRVMSSVLAVKNIAFLDAMKLLHETFFVEKFIKENKLLEDNYIYRKQHLF